VRLRAGRSETPIRAHQGQEVGERLAGPGVRREQDVAAGEHLRDGRALRIRPRCTFSGSTCRRRLVRGARVVCRVEYEVFHAGLTVDGAAASAGGKTKRRVLATAASQAVGFVSPGVCKPGCCGACSGLPLLGRSRHG